MPFSTVSYVHRHTSEREETHFAGLKGEVRVLVYMYAKPHLCHYVIRFSVDNEEVVFHSCTI